MTLVAAITKSIFNTVVVLVMLWFLSHVMTIAGGESAYVSGTMESLTYFMRMPNPDHLPLIVGLIIAVFLGSMLFHHKNS